MKNKVKEKRLKLNLTQEELSKLSGLSRQTISELENENLTNVSVLTMKKISRALKSKITDIFLIK